MILSIDGSLVAQIRVQERLEQAEKAIGELVMHIRHTPAGQLSAGGRARSDQALVVARRGLAPGSHQEEGAEQPVRASRGKQSSPRQIWSFQVHVQRNQQATLRARKLPGWRICATNQQTAALGLVRAVEASRDASLVECNAGHLIAGDKRRVDGLPELPLAWCMWDRWMSSMMIIAWAGLLPPPSFDHRFAGRHRPLRRGLSRPGGASPGHRRTVSGHSHLGAPM